MLSITLQVNLHIVVHAHQHCVGDAFQSHNQKKGHVFEDDENRATIVAQSKQSVKSDHQIQTLKSDGHLRPRYTFGPRTKRPPRPFKKGLNGRWPPETGGRLKLTT